MTKPPTGATFAERKAMREAAEKPTKKAEAKAVEDDDESTENKAVDSKKSTDKAAKKP